LLFGLIPSSPRSQGWSTNFGAPPTGQGLNGGGNTLLVYQDQLVVGGVFTQAGSVSANRVAAWDGLQWHALGTGIQGGDIAVWKLVEHGGHLIAACQVNGGTGSLMRWDSSTWTAMSPPGTSQPFWTAWVHDGLLYVNPWEGTTSKLAWWDGSTWSSVAMYQNSVVLGMATYQNQLFMTGGTFSGYLVSWDGNAFGGPGYVFDNDAYALHVNDQLLYVGGAWVSGGEVPPGTQSAIASWDGDNWIPFPVDIYNHLNTVEGMGSYQGRLVLCGFGGATSYNGPTEVSLDDGDMYAARDAEVFHGDLYVTGAFVSVGNPSLSSHNIGEWSEPLTGVGDTPNAAGRLSVNSAPNPFNPAVTISIQVPSKQVVDVTICDVAGRVVRHVSSGVRGAGLYQVAWDGADNSGGRMPSGVYFAKVVAGNDIETRKLVLLR
jgi:hypothetical protein